MLVIKNSKQGKAISKSTALKSASTMTASVVSVNTAFGLSAVRSTTSESSNIVGEKCSVCIQNIVDGKDQALFCEGHCKRWFHRKCAGISVAQFNALCLCVEWFQKSCKEELGSNQHFTGRSKARKLVGMLYRQFSTWADTTTLRSLYLTCKRPHLEYACQLWDPYTHHGNQLLESVQKIACKVCLNLDYDCMLELLDIPPLSNRRKYVSNAHYYE